MNILSASDIEHDYAIRCTWVLHSTCTDENSACVTGLQKETNIYGHVKNLGSTWFLLDSFCMHEFLIKVLQPLNRPCGKDVY